MKARTQVSDDGDAESEAAVGRLLAMCRGAVEDGDSQLALATVLHAIRLTQGNEAIAGLLDEAKLKAAREHAAQEAAASGGKTGGAARRRSCCGRGASDDDDEDDDRAAEAEAAREQQRLRDAMVSVVSDLAAQTNSIVAERDPSRTAVLQDAFVDGSSVVCTRCSALVARSRWTAHSTMWCDALESGGSDDDESD